jgi:hypothetical protein
LWIAAAGYWVIGLVAGFWLCGVVFLLMAAAPLAIVVGSDPKALGRMLLGDGLAEPDPAEPDGSPGYGQGRLGNHGRCR